MEPIMTKKIFIKFMVIAAFFSDAFSAEDKSDVQHMNISFAGTQLIGRFEGFREKIYMCPGGRPTIGFGHVVREGEIDKFPGIMSQEEGYILLGRDIETVYVPDIKRYVKVPLTQRQFDALTSFDYNLGAKNFRGSTLLKLLNSGDDDNASLQFPLWRNANGKYLPGLFKRRLAEMFIFRNDDHVPLELATISTKVPGQTLMDVYQALPEKLKEEARDIYLTYNANNH
jgi:lysozyme